MKILLLSQFFTPEPFFKALPFARGLAARGHSVEVLTGFPNYPGGQVYPGYRIRLWQRENLEGIRVNRVALYPSHDLSSIRRALNYTSFALTASVLGPLLTSKPDVVYVYHPPATAGLPALVIKALKGVPIVYDVHDLWPDTVGTTGMISNSLIMGALGKWCSFVYRHADHVTVVSPGFRRTLIERGVPEDKISVVYNWCDEQGNRPRERDEELSKKLGLAGRFNVMFAGMMGRGQGLDAVLEAAKLCAGVNPLVQFVFIGAGVERERLQSIAAASPNVRFLPAQPVSEISSFLALADVLLVHLKDDPLFRITIPSKTQAYLAVGKAVLMAVSGDAADIVKRAQAGVTVQPGNAPEIADAVLRLANLDMDSLRQMGANGRSFYLREMSMEVGIRRYEQLFQSLSGSPGQPDVACPTGRPR